MTLPPEARAWARRTPAGLKRRGAIRLGFDFFSHDGAFSVPESLDLYLVPERSGID